MVELFTDGGRLIRPILYKDDSRVPKDADLYSRGQFVFDTQEWTELSHFISTYDDQNKSKEVLWSKLVTGFHDKKVENFDPFHIGMYNWEDLYAGSEETGIYSKQ